MILRYFFDEDLAQASYLVGCAVSGEAVVIDPLRAAKNYLETAASLDLKIVAVAETHIHADYVSGARQLAAESGARMYLSAEGGPDWQYMFGDESNRTLVYDGDSIRIGNVSLRAIHTPGHTPEHLSYLLVDHATSEIPVALFTGDFVFVGDVGRPDLLEVAAGIQGTMEEGAKQLFHSLKKLEGLPDSLLIWPGHGAGSACGKSLGGSPVTTLGYQRRTNWAFQIAAESKFVDEVLAGQPEPPPYFAVMKKVNKAGPELLDASSKLPNVSSLVGEYIDVRPVASIRSGSSPDAVLLPDGKGQVKWAGWMLKNDLPYTLVAESQEAADDAAKRLASIGIEEIVGWMTGEAVPDKEPVPSLDADLLDGDVVALDVRTEGEWAEGHLANSIHIPLQQLSKRLGELPKNRPIAIYCASGYRTLVAYGLLRRARFELAAELAGGLDRVKESRPEILVGYP